MRISLLRFFKTITIIWLMRFYGLFILLVRSLARDLANAIFGKLVEISQDFVAFSEYMNFTSRPKISTKGRNFLGNQSDFCNGFFSDNMLHNGIKKVTFENSNLQQIF